MPYAHLRDMAITSPILNSFVAALIQSILHVGDVFLYAACALLVAGAVIGKFLFRPNGMDCIRFRVWSAVNSFFAFALMTFTLYLIVAKNSTVVGWILLGWPILGSVSLALWLILVKKIERRPAFVNTKIIGSGSALGAVLAAIPALTTGSIVVGIGYLLATIFICMAVLFLAVDLRALHWFYRQSGQ